MGATDRRCQRTRVVGGDDVVDDETLHPGSVVWLGKPALCAAELARFDPAPDRSRGIEVPHSAGRVPGS